MHVHLPKPLHGWREFAGEVGTIVVGVLIALSAEQLVERVHWQHKVEAVRDAVRLELDDDDLPQAYARIVVSRCVSQQLEALRTAAKAGQPGPTFMAKAILYAPPARTWDNDAQKLAEQSDLAAHLTTEQINGVALVYRYVSRIDEQARAERSDRLKLQLSRYGSGSLSSDDAAQLSDTIDGLSYDNNQITAFAYALLQVSKGAFGSDLPQADKRRILAEARDAYGGCAGEIVPPNGLGDRQVRAPNGRGLYFSIADGESGR